MLFSPLPVNVEKGGFHVDCGEGKIAPAGAWGNGVPGEINNFGMQ